MNSEPGDHLCIHKLHPPIYLYLIICFHLYLTGYVVEKLTLKCMWLVRAFSNYKVCCKDLLITTINLFVNSVLVSAKATTIAYIIQVGNCGVVFPTSHLSVILLLSRLFLWKVNIA